FATGNSLAVYFSVTNAVGTCNIFAAAVFWSQFTALETKSCEILRILVTGATGFVGRWAARALATRGAEVFSLSRAASQPGASGHAIAADLLDHASIRKVVNDIRPNTVLHLAWDVSHGQF